MLRHKSGFFIKFLASKALECFRSLCDQLKKETTVGDSRKQGSLRSCRARSPPLLPTLGDVTRYGGIHDEDKSAPPFQDHLSCSRMAEGGTLYPAPVHPGYFLLISVILSSAIECVISSQEIVHLHHKHCTHQHPKPHEVS